MIVVDTSVWIEFFRQSDQNMSDLLTAHLEDNEGYWSERNFW